MKSFNEKRTCVHTGETVPLEGNYAKRAQRWVPMPTQNSNPAFCAAFCFAGAEMSTELPADCGERVLSLSNFCLISASCSGDGFTFARKWIAASHALRAFFRFLTDLVAPEDSEIATNIVDRSNSVCTNDGVTRFKSILRIFATSLFTLPARGPCAPVSFAGERRIGVATKSLRHQTDPDYVGRVHRDLALCPRFRFWNPLLSTRRRFSIACAITAARGPGRTRRTGRPYVAPCVHRSPDNFLPRAE